MESDADSEDETLRGRAAARVTRVYSRAESKDEERRYEGTLLSEARVGVPLVLAVPGECRLETSAILRIEEASPNVVIIETSNSRYCVRRLWSSS